MKAVIIDVIAVLVVIFFTWWGSRRGLFLTLSALISVIGVVLSFFLAAQGTELLKRPLTWSLTPIVQGRIVRLSQAAAMESGQDLDSPLEMELPAIIPSGIQNMLEEDGLMEQLELVFQNAMGQEGLVAREVIDQVVEQATPWLVERVSAGVLYVVLLAAALLLLRRGNYWVAAVLADIPMLHRVSLFGGAIYGLIEGMLLVWLVLWLAAQMQLGFPMQNTPVVQFFTACRIMGMTIL